MRIALPELRRLDAESLAGLTVSGFDGDSLDLRAMAIQDVVIADNRIGSLRLQTRVQNIDFRGNTIGNSEVRTLGTRITTD